MPPWPTAGYLGRTQSLSRRPDDAGLLADPRVHDGQLVRPTLRWKAGERHVVYWKQCDNLYRDKSPLSHQRAYPANGISAHGQCLNCTADTHHIALSPRTTAMLVTDSPALPDGAVYLSFPWREASRSNPKSSFAGPSSFAPTGSPIMKAPDGSLANPSLSEAAVETIDALHQHRLHG